MRGGKENSNLFSQWLEEPVHLVKSILVVQQIDFFVCFL
jgi:hypothetical protein